MLDVPGSRPGISTPILFSTFLFLLQTETGTVLHALSDESMRPFPESHSFIVTQILLLQSPPQWKAILLLEKRTDIEP